MTTTAGAGGEVADRIKSEPGVMRLGGVVPADVAGLPAEPDALLDRLRTLQAISGTSRAELAPNIVDLLAQAGVPATVRASLLRALHALGYRPVAPREADVGAPYQGPGPEGAVLRLVLDADTVPVVLETVNADGSSVVASYSEIDLRADHES
jgi:hypothetical protein